METKWLEDFVSLAETRSFSRSAHLRHVTQPAFSRRIQALEAWAGTDLVDQLLPVRIGPLPGLELRAMGVGHEDLLGRQARGEPVTGSVWPVIHEARSDARKRTASAMSSGVPMRRMAMRSAKPLRNSSL